MMDALLEALRFVRSRIDIAILEVEAGDPVSAARALEQAADKLEISLDEIRAAA